MSFVCATMFGRIHLRPWRFSFRTKAEETFCILGAVVQVVIPVAMMMIGVSMFYTLRKKENCILKMFY